jgi:hypothetical protein
MVHIGVMTLSEKIALAGLLVGMVFGARGWLYRARIAGAEASNELINQILEQAEHRQMSESERRALDLCNRMSRKMKQLIKKCSIAAIVALGITLSPGALRTTPEGQQKIAGWEDCRNTPYYCTAGVLTVGIGSTGRVESVSTAAGLTICGTLKTVLTRILKAGICRSRL